MHRGSRQRIEKVRRRLQELQLDALLINATTHVRYLFGFTGSNALGLITTDRALLVTDRRYTEQVSQEVTEAEIIIGKQDLLAEFKAAGVFTPGVRLAFEAEHLTVKNYSHLKKNFPDVKFVASERIVDRFSSVKDEEEVTHIRAAGRICGQVLQTVIPSVRAGVPERDLAAEISYQARLHGSEREAFEPIVASGARSALPHGLASGKRLGEGELVVMDFGAVVNGYVADFTRTLVVGEPTATQSHAAHAVREALELAEQAARPAMRARELDAVARDFLESRGYGEAFAHSLGHGIGLEVHELPRIGERSKDVLAAGNVITLEPGVYLPEVGGVRIEDDFVVTDRGVENLTPFPREVIVVG